MQFQARGWYTKMRLVFDISRALAMSSAEPMPRLKIGAMVSIQLGIKKWKPAPPQQALGCDFTLT